MKIYNENYNKHHDSEHKLNPKASKKMLLKVKEIFEANGIEFWLHFGTLLGAYRDKILMPWDKDVDVAIKVENREKLLQLIEKGVFAIEGLQCFRDDICLVSFCYKNEYLDVNIYTDENKYLQGKEDANHYYYCCTMYIEKWQIDNGFSKIKFLGTEFNAPNDIEKYLERYDNWRVKSG